MCAIPYFTIALPIWYDCYIGTRLRCELRTLRKSFFKEKPTTFLCRTWGTFRSSQTSAYDLQAKLEPLYRIGIHAHPALRCLLNHSRLNGRVKSLRVMLQLLWCTFVAWTHSLRWAMSPMPQSSPSSEIATIELRCNWLRSYLRDPHRYSYGLLSRIHVSSRYPRQ